MQRERGQIRRVHEAAEAGDVADLEHFAPTQHANLDTWLASWLEAGTPSLKMVPERRSKSLFLHKPRLIRQGFQLRVFNVEQGQAVCGSHQAPTCTGVSPACTLIAADFSDGAILAPRLFL